MDRLTLARPYANAAFSDAQQKNMTDQWSKALAWVAQVMTCSQCVQFLKNPDLDAAKKMAFLATLCEEVLFKTLENFLRLLIENKRIQLLPEITYLFDQLRNAHENTQEVEVVSFLPLSTQEEKLLATTLAKRLNKNITITPRVDGSLLGGLLIKAGDKVIDGTIRGKLNQLEYLMKN